MRITQSFILAALLHPVWLVWGAAPLQIPRVEAPPPIEELAANGNGDGWISRYARVDGFIQRDPSDGEPASQETVVYLGFDDVNLYVVFFAFDEEPEQVRGRLRRRERLDGEDWVAVWLDTFADRQRALVFSSNPRGVQEDAMFTEGEGHDPSFDTVWQSDGRLTANGYVVRYALPFKTCGSRARRGKTGTSSCTGRSGG